MQTTFSLPSLSCPLWPGVVAPDKGPIYESRRIKTYVLMLNWIVEIKTVFDIETAYLCWTELFEIELFWHLTENENYTYT